MIVLLLARRFVSVFAIERIQMLSRHTGLCVIENFTFLLTDTPTPEVSSHIYTYMTACLKRGICFYVVALPGDYARILWQGSY